MREDWEEQVELIATGRLDELDARMGTYLQIRPKAANARLPGAGSGRGRRSDTDAAAGVLPASDFHALDPGSRNL